MKTPSSVKDSGQNAPTDKATRRVVWALVGVMTLSFSFGVAMFVSEEHRTQKLDETMAKYQARRRGP